MRTVGLHLRVLTNLADVAVRALRFDLTSFQCFLVHQETKKRLNPSNTEIKEFLKLRSKFGDLYVHGTYWINICGKRFKQAHSMLKREIERAERLDFSHYILHPGSATGWQNRLDGIDCLVRVLNDVTKRNNALQIVLENTAHGGRTVGSDLLDFKLIRQKLDFPERVSFCVDTAHAHAFGYDIVNPDGLDAFVNLLEDALGLESIALLHLNDNLEERGLKRDKHSVLGQGDIGIDPLYRLATDQRLKDIPIVLELPPVSDSEQKELVDMVKKWHKE